MISVDAYDEADFGGTAAATVDRPSDPTPEPTTFAQLQGDMVFVEAGKDPFHNAVSYSSRDEQRYAMAEVMPDGFNDTALERQRQMDRNPKDDNALLAPRRDEIEDYLQASHEQRQRQKLSQPTNARRLGARSLLWPQMGETESSSDGRTSYADYGNDADAFDHHAQAALRRSHVAEVFADNLR
jgi:hypothetical protein